MEVIANCSGAMFDNSRSNYKDDYLKSDSTISRITDKVIALVKEWQERPLQDILIACVDGLNGFPQASEAVYPETEIQQCIIHQICNTTKYVSYKDLKKLMADLKLVYAAPDEATALEELESFGEKWTGRRRDWAQIRAQLEIYFAERLTKWES